ncbi:hypothetical protein [Herbaspirillum sp. meg3]|uniref:hypothetical protein n=1 Tax=Herbaspirillum sp. meg3 TaxID=2025949 RepID=UPI0012FE751E|nr:hypothetical protein [Herbaspirillum sp. meg3]
MTRLIFRIKLTLHWDTLEGEDHHREMPFVLDPAVGPSISIEPQVFFNIGSIADIAAVYSQSGKKLAGTGPSYLA